jgi:tight adherence protein C
VIEPAVAAAALLSAMVVAGVSGWLLPATRRLAPRVRPYSIASRTSLGGSADVRAMATAGTTSAVRGLLGPVIETLADRCGRLIDGRSDDTLARRIRQAGLYPELSEEGRVSAYRVRQLGSVVAWLAGAVGYSLATGAATRNALVFAALGLVVGGTRQRGRLDRAIEDRQNRMRIEIYTINQLLAVRARAGGGVIQAVSQLVERGRGEVVSELREALRLHRAGVRASDAFHRIASMSHEPFCARTYSLLAVAEERGVDLAEGLLVLSEDVREARREAIRRSATRRRAAMLVPTIAVLAPVMLIFIGAPLPHLVFQRF